MHCGKNNNQLEYSIRDDKSGAEVILESTTRERELGIIITPDLK